MRLLVYGMQSSGATAFTMMLAQRPDCLALVDIANNYAAPRLDTAMDFVAKAVITTAYPLAVHVERFRPDKVVLLLRDPRDNYQSLAGKPYRNHSGLMHEKFLALDQVFAERAHFDAVVEYEDFVARRPSVLATMTALGWPVEPEYYSFTRRHDALLAALWRHLPALMPEMDMVFGNARGLEVTERHRDKPRDPEVTSTLERLCPRLLAHYRAKDGGGSGG